jgi:hypothetical protein
MKNITSFKARLFRVGKSSWAIVIPKSKFEENILDETKGKEYLFSVSEVE